MLKEAEGHKVAELLRELKFELAPAVDFSQINHCYEELTRIKPTANFIQAGEPVAPTTITREIVRSPRAWRCLHLHGKPFHSSWKDFFLNRFRVPNTADLLIRSVDGEFVFSKPYYSSGDPTKCVGEVYDIFITYREKSLYNDTGVTLYGR